MQLQCVSQKNKVNSWLYINQMGVTYRIWASMGSKKSYTQTNEAEIYKERVQNVHKYKLFLNAVSMCSQMEKLKKLNY